MGTRKNRKLCRAVGLPASAPPWQRCLTATVFWWGIRYAVRFGGAATPGGANSNSNTKDGRRHAAKTTADRILNCIQPAGFSGPCHRPGLSTGSRTTASIRRVSVESPGARRPQKNRQIPAQPIRLGTDFQLKLGTIVPSPSPEIYEIPIEVTANGQTDGGSVYVTKDAKFLIRGEIKPLSVDPFAENRSKIHSGRSSIQGPSQRHGNRSGLQRLRMPPLPAAIPRPKEPGNQVSSSKVRLQELPAGPDPPLGPKRRHRCPMRPKSVPASLLATPRRPIRQPRRPIRREHLGQANQLRHQSQHPRRNLPRLHGQPRSQGRSASANRRSPIPKSAKHPHSLRKRPRINRRRPDHS